MLYLVITIALTSTFFILFRYFSLFKVNTFQAIVANYLVCMLTGVVYEGFSSFKASVLDWAPYAVFIGFLFLVTFYLMALTVNKVSISVSSVANKTSLVIPVAYSLLFLPSAGKEMSWWNYVGIPLAICSIVMSSISRSSIQEEKRSGKKLFLFFLPASVFLLGGTIDTMLNYVNLHHLMPGDEALFSIITFLSAGVVGAVVIGARSVMQKKLPDGRSVLAGVILGIPNYFSIVFLLRALSAFNNDGALVYTIVNCGIILCSSLLAVVLFKESLSKVNVIGLILALCAIFLLFY